MANPDAAPLQRTIQSTVPGQGTAATDDAWNIAEAPFDATVTGVSYTAEAAIAGHASNNRAFSLVNKGQDGSGSTVIATITTTASPDNSFVANDEKAITLSGTPANLNVAAGDILQWVSDANASGVVDPGGLVQVTLARR